MATQLSGRPLSVPLEVPDCRVDEEILSRFDSLNICQVDTMSGYSESVDSSTAVEAGESSSWASSRGTRKSNSSMNASRASRFEKRYSYSANTDTAGLA